MAIINNQGTEGEGHCARPSSGQASVQPLSPPVASGTLPVLAQGGNQAYLRVEGGIRESTRTLLPPDKTGGSVSQRSPGMVKLKCKFG